MDYIEKLIALRKDNDIKQKEIAKLLNKSQRGYSHLERRKAKLTIEDLITLCKFYNVSPDYILGLTKNQNPLPKE